MNMPQVVKWIIFTYVLYLVFGTVGCGSSGHGTPETPQLQTPAEVSVETLQEPDSAATSQSLLESNPRQWNERQQPTPVIGAGVVSAAMVCGVALPLVLVALLTWPRSSDLSNPAVSPRHR